MTICWAALAPGQKKMKRDPDLWNLDHQGEDLRWGGCSLMEVARNYGTPVYVVNPILIRRCHEELLSSFESEGLQARIFFSFKTNPVPDVLKCIAALGCGAEIISEFELWLAAKLGLDGSRILVNGFSKTEELLRQALLHEVGLINLESLEEIRLLQALASRLGKTAKIGLRINPCLSKSCYDFTLFAGTRSSTAGFRHADPEWKAALRILRDDSQLKLQGLHFHIGSGILKANPFLEAIEAALLMWTDLLEMGFRPTILDIGGGFGIPTLKELNLVEAIRFFGWSKPPKAPRTNSRVTLIAEIAPHLSHALRDYSRTYGVDLPILYLEPGRALVGSSQLILLQVLMLRNRPGNYAAAICDAGALSLSPMLLAERHRILVVNKSLVEPLAMYDILGNLPAPLDLIALHQELPPLTPGDVLAVMDTGAYFTALGNNFSGPRLPIVMIEDGRPVLIRKRETFQDMVSRDLAMQDILGD